MDVKYDNAAGVFNTAVTYSKEGGVNPGNAFEFTNVYKALPTDPVTGVFSAIKTVTPSEGNSYTMAGGEFAFTLTPSASNPAADPVEAASVKNDATGAVSFINSVTYTEPGTYVYTIKEEQGGVGGITYDDSIFTVTVDVTDDGSGKLSAATSITKDNEEVSAITFDNSYDPAETGLSIGGTKELTGKDLEADMFSFTLTGIDGAPMPVDGQTTATAKNTAGGVFNFGEIKYDRVGEYKYQVSEVNDGAVGVTYDTNTYEVTISVTDENGALKAVPSGDNSQIVFKNSYAPIPLVLEGDAAIGGTKNLTGRTMNEGEFAFELKDGETVIAEATNNADGTFSFSGIKIDKVGQYHYTVTEKNDGKGGITYDKTIWNVTVDAYDDNGYIKANVTYNASDSDSDVIVFNNTYAAEGTSVSLGAVKVLEGRDITDGEFTFRLEDVDGNLISEVKNDANGKVTFDKIAYETPGTFEYVVYEVSGNEENMTYDENKHVVTVTVEDNLEGHLVAEVTGDENLVFTNTYAEPEKPVEPAGPSTGVWTNPAPFAVTFTASLAAILAILYRRLH